MAPLSQLRHYTITNSPSIPILCYFNDDCRYGASCRYIHIRSRLEQKVEQLWQTIDKLAKVVEQLSGTKPRARSHRRRNTTKSTNTPKRTPPRPTPKHNQQESDDKKRAQGPKTTKNCHQNPPKKVTTPKVPPKRTKQTTTKEPKPAPKQKKCKKKGKGKGCAKAQKISEKSDKGNKSAINEAKFMEDTSDWQVNQYLDEIHQEQSSGIETPATPITPATSETEDDEENSKIYFYNQKNIGKHATDQ